MQKRPTKRADVISSLIRMETWGRDRLANDVSQAEKLHKNSERERRHAQQNLMAVQDDMRRIYDHGALLEMDSIDRIRNHLMQVEALHRESEKRERKSKQVLDSLRTQLEKQALHVRGLERVAEKRGRREIREYERHESRVMDDLMLMRRRNENAKASR